MPRHLLSRLALLVLAMSAVTAAAVGVLPGTAAAHNTLVSSDPADGASLSFAPASITWVFGKAVPLETMTVTLIDATGARSELSGSAHDPAGEAQVVTPLPPLQPGPITIRWRLVSPDGHAVSGRVGITVIAPTDTTQLTTPAQVAITVPAAAPPTSDTTTEETDGSSSTGSVLRWILRYASYLAIMAVVGILLTSVAVWSGAGGHPVLRRILSGSLLVTVILGFAQLLVVASDVSGKPAWSSFGSIGAATTTYAGMAFALRMTLASVMWIVLFRASIVHREVYWTAVSLPGLGLLGTWAFAGHARSMRWPAVGVTTDVAHHAAAAAWIGGLAIVGWIVIPTVSADVLVPAVRRFARLAAVSVGVLVGTGVVQTLRLVGNPTDLLEATHGRLLVAKMVVLTAMLVIANVNRRRLDHRLDRLDDPVTFERRIGPLRRAVIAEFAIGVAIVGITAAMVVSPPSSPTTTPDDDPVYYVE